MKLSEIRGEAAIDAIADIIDPVMDILADEEIQAEIKSGKPRTMLVKPILKKKKKEILTILAILNGEEPATFNPNLIQLPIMLLGLLNEIDENKELADLFQSQRQMKEGVSFGVVTDSTKAEQ